MVVLKLFPKRESIQYEIIHSTILGWEGRHFNQENHSIPTTPRGELNYIINLQIQSATFHQKSCFARINPQMFTLGNTSSPSLPSPPAPCTHVHAHAHTHAHNLFFSQDPLCFTFLCCPNMYSEVIL